MNVLKVNETPVRTSRNFNINNIKLDNIDLPSIISKFENTQIINNDSKVKIENVTSPMHLSYGLGDELTGQVANGANQKINLTIDSKTNKEIQINFNFDDNNKVLLEDIEITANEATSETIIIKYNSESKGTHLFKECPQFDSHAINSSSQTVSAFHNGIIRVNAKQDSVLNIIIVNLLNEVSNNFLAIQNNFEAGAKVNYTIVDFGGKSSVTNYYSNMIGDSCKNTVNTIYLGRDSQIFDLNYIAELRGKENNIKIEVQGALADNAKKHFKGTIDFKKGAKKSIGDENESCTLLSNTAKSISLPMLLCSEEDVEGNHSSSAGKIDEKELFYIMTRGFSLKEAMRLMVKARFNKILETISNEDLKNEIINEIDKRLD